MKVTVIASWGGSRAIGEFDSRDSVKSVCERMIPIENLNRVTIVVNGAFGANALSESLGIAAENGKVYISAAIKAGEIWVKDDDGVYRYKGDYV